MDEIKGVVTQWQDSIIKGLDLDPELLWNEDYDVTPYYTDKPDWDALNALLVYIAAKYSDKEVPATVDKNFDVYEHPVVKEFLETRDFKLTPVSYTHLDVYKRQGMRGKRHNSRIPH